MDQPTRSQRFLQKAAALIAAIEVHNKPDFRYREESFTILALNAWELLLKAELPSLNENDPKCLYVYETGPARKVSPPRNAIGNATELATVKL